jgi:hypothetical protein
MSAGVPIRAQRESQPCVVQCQTVSSFFFVLRYDNLKIFLERDLMVPLPIVYSVVELLQLSASPLVGISAEAQLIVDDLVAHHVWRRGQQSGLRKAGSQDYKHRTSKPRSYSSMDDSDHSN